MNELRLTEDGKVIPETQDIEKIEREYGKPHSAAEWLRNYQLAQAEAMVRWYKAETEKKNSK